MKKPTALSENEEPAEVLPSEPAPSSVAPVAVEEPQMPAGYIWDTSSGRFKKAPVT